MSTSSGLRGTCDIYLHQNNKHRTTPCPVPRCRNRWKRCQITGGCFRNTTDFTYRINNLVFGGIRQRDVSRAQRDDYKNTGNSGGDTSSGKIGSSSPWASSSP
ncbi:hypothetical protein BDV24DRAFT_147751 [Aspergillus arachidicola]|uniref:Uncharacterized protein n=1 Tax=Aspergillus arachidicola TaxID=656916 RepID=A0A5N6YL38_9EURO|nr:hypothetical protein BDV24DRAFT_147751 [Aspergillus arachidicola]